MHFTCMTVEHVIHIQHKIFMPHEIITKYLSIYRIDIKKMSRE